MLKSRLFATALLALLVATGCSSTATPSPASSPATPTAGALATAAATPTAGAPATAAATPIATIKTPLNIDFANFTNASAYLKSFGDGFVAAAKTVGFNIKEYDNNLDGPTAVNNANLMVQDKPDIIIDANGVAGVGDAMGKIFTASGIPCIAVNVEIPGCPFANFVTSQAGVDNATAIAPIAQAMGFTGKNTTVLLVQDAAGGTELNDVQRYFYTTLAGLMPGLDVVKPADITATTTTIGTTGIQVDGNGTIEDAFTAVKNVLPTIPSSQRIIVAGMNDDVVQGAERAISDAGRSSTSIFCGQGGSTVTVGLLRTDPSWVCEGTTFTAFWSEYVMAMVGAYFEGVKLPDFTSVGQAALTKANVDQYYDSSGNVKALPPLDAGNAYLANVGILQKFGNIPDLP